MSLVPLMRLFDGTRPDGLPIAERDGRVFTLGELRMLVAGGAAWLRARQARHVLLAAEDGWDFLAGMLAAWHAGAALVLPPNTRPGTLDALRGEADIVLDGAPEWLDPAGLGFPEAEACRLAVFTSGSTGERKRIDKTLAQFEREVAVLEQVWGDGLADACVVGMVSPLHVFGLTFRLLWPVMAGRRLTARTLIAWESLAASLGAFGIVVASPAQLGRLEGLAPLPAGRVRAVFTAGAPLSKAAARQCAEFLGVTPIDIFGSTETGAFAWRDGGVADDIWRPLPGTRVSLGEDDLLAIESPNLLPGEVVHSADRATLVPGGFRFAGRADSIVKVEGRRVSLIALEADLSAIAEVRAARLLMHDGRLAALLVPSPAGWEWLGREGRFRFTRYLRRRLAEQHEPGSLPRRWRLVPALPQTAMGKPDREAMLALLDEASPFDETLPHEPIVSAIRLIDAGVELDLILPAALLYFQGHFPGYGLLPGVVQMHWAIGYAARHLGIRADAGRAQVKFRRPLRPDDRLTLALAVTGGRLSFSYRRGGEICANGSLALGSAAPEGAAPEDSTAT